ncbi:MAG TPA: aminopeptidase [Candidatus Thermoplasmatota archaeon]|nr:aminopeptidase [Candidatus Thermoplasmatota archaeon]
MGTLEQGARNAVVTCMAVRPGEKVVLVTDRIVAEVGDALERAARAVTPQVHRFVLEDLGARPLRELPEALAAAAAFADVSLWAAASVKGELPVRMEYRKHLKGARHGHMPGITRQLMEEGMCADYDAVADLTLRLHKRVQGVRSARVTNLNGTDFEVVFHPRWNWLPDTGKFHAPGDWGNLPAGEVYTAPAWLHGRIVTNLLGDFFSEKYRELSPPLAFDVFDNRIVLDSLTGATPEVVREFREYLSSDPMGTRAGEFAMGTNLGLSKLVGNLLQDEKIPGVHVAFGHPYNDQTGAPWTARTHVDVVILDTDVWLDGEQVQARGRYLL